MWIYRNLIKCGTPIMTRGSSKKLPLSLEHAWGSSWGIETSYSIVGATNMRSSILFKASFPFIYETSLWHLGQVSFFVQVCSQSCSLSPEAGVYGSPELILTLWFSVSSAIEESRQRTKWRENYVTIFPPVHSPRMPPWCVCVACYCFQGHLTMQKSLFFYLFLPSSVQI